MVELELQLYFSFMSKQEIQLKRIQKEIDKEEKLQAIKDTLGITGTKAQQKIKLRDKLLEINPKKYG